MAGTARPLIRCRRPTRRTTCCRLGWQWLAFVPEQAIDLATAIAAYTTGGAYANFCEDHRGTLAPGKAADLIALSDNLFELPAGQIKDCRVELTMVEGQIRHQL